MIVCVCVRVHMCGLSILSCAFLPMKSRAITLYPLEARDFIMNLYRKLQVGSPCINRITLSLFGGPCIIFVHYDH